MSGGFLPDWSVGEWLGYSGIIVLALALTIVATTTLWWMLHAWRSADDLRATQFSSTPAPRGTGSPSWSRVATRRR